jgi:hypothetical protein
MSVESPWDDDEPPPPTPGWLWVLAVLLVGVMIGILTNGERT